MEKREKTGHPLVNIQGATRQPRLTLEQVRRKLEQARGPRYWRTLEELTRTEGFDQLIADEFPRHAASWNDAVSRRSFLKLMSASLALAGLTGCTRQPPETIVPYVRQPEEIVPGKPLYFATAMPFAGSGLPLLAESHMGRPTKVEGNPDHPASGGAADAFAQASVLSLYDPDRSQTINYIDEVRPWGAFLGAMRGPVTVQHSVEGAGLRFLTQSVGSPTLAWQLENLLRQYPQARWHQWEPVNRDAIREGARMAFGQVVEPQYRFEKAEVVVSLDADFFSSTGIRGWVRYAREFADRRDPSLGEHMLRLYAVESSPTPTGAKADHRLSVRASEVEDVARGIATALGIPGVAQPPKPVTDFLLALVEDLKQHRGSSLVIAGDHQPAVVHALAHAINEVLGNAGKTVVYTDPVEAHPVGNGASLRDLIGDMNAGKVQLLVILGGNPVYDAPADLDFASALRKVDLRIHLAPYQDETSLLCQWHIPEAHYLESWSDVRAHDGTVSIVQPLIAPLYEAKTAHEVLAALTDQPEQTSYETVRSYWQQQQAGADIEQQWRRWLHDGLIAGTAFEPRQLQARGSGFPPPSEYSSADEIIFRPDPCIHDGRFANNGWLQELPRPMTKLTWDNAVLMGPAMAERMGLEMQGGNHEEAPVVELEREGRKVQGPVWILPGHPDNSVTVYLGHGRQQSGHLGTGVGFNAYQLRSAEQPWFATGVRVRPTGATYQLATTQGHQRMQGRHLVVAGTMQELQEDADFVHELVHQPHESLYPPVEYPGHAWGMAIDLNRCVGCNACIAACQSENNIAVVGKEQVLKEREMHWLRVDVYYEGPPQEPTAGYFQPVPCMHCENAPCEYVCPVGATVHSEEGLNDMVYNRCVGTRYCSNNCPYKVRRFNFFLFSDYTTPALKAMRNPDVTVRSRGVMEKCTYCVQRINHGRMDAEKENRPLHDGEIETACQQTCPANAIVFGDINDPASKVSKLKADKRNYALLAELNTRPRTTYLAEIRNLNPGIESQRQKEAGEAEG